MRTVSSRHVARRGSVIVVVLVTLLLASMMLMKFMESSAVELTLATREADQERLRADAYGALETLLAVMAEIKAVDDDKLNAPGQGWGDPYGYAGISPREGVTVSYAFTDESGKLSLPKMTFEDMVELAQALGLTDIEAKRFSDGLYAWMTADHIPQDIEAEASRYESQDPPVTIPKRSLRSWDELRAVRVAREYIYDEQGSLTPFGAALRENVSLYSFEGTNVNALAPSLGTARGWDATQVEQVAGYKAGLSSRPAGAPPWFRSVEDLTPVIGANADVEGLGAEVKLLRVEVTVAERLASMKLVALVAVDDSVELPAAVAAEETQAGGATGGAGGAAGGPGGAAASGAAGAGRGGRSGGARAGQGGTGGQGGQGGQDAQSGGGSGQTEEKLDYPFGILEVIETSGPPPVVSPATEEETPPTP